MIAVLVALVLLIVMIWYQRSSSYGPTTVNPQSNTTTTSGQWQAVPTGTTPTTPQMAPMAAVPMGTPQMAPEGTQWVGGIPIFGGI